MVKSTMTESSVISELKMFRCIPVYENHLWYPVVIQTEDGNKIVEMLGKEVNDWNYEVSKNTPRLPSYYI